MTNMVKPKCKLIGTDSNVFALAGKVVATLKGAGQRGKADEFWEKLKQCKNYDAASALMTEYVDVY